MGGSTPTRTGQITVGASSASAKATAPARWRARSSSPVSPSSTTVARKLREGESWQWHEFKLTAFHFPGQSYYHSGLLVEGRGKKVFFAGDSGSPTGVDDHCCPNRNFLGAGKGFRRLVVRHVRRELNQHADLLVNRALDARANVEDAASRR